MNKKLIFLLDKETPPKTVLTIRPHLKELKGKRTLYLDLLAKFCADPALLKALVRQECLYQNISPLSDRVQIMALNQIRISDATILKTLCQKGLLYFQDQQLQIGDSASLCYKVKEEGRIEGWVGNFPISSYDVMLTSFFVKDGLIGWFDPHVHPRWIRKVYPSDLILQKKQWEEFLEDFSSDPPPDGPQVIWESTKHSCNIYPILQLKDSLGLFANLRLHYEGIGEVDFHDLSGKVQGQRRDVKAEKDWERDLIEAGFEKKGREYFCSSAHVIETLLFLLEIGWKVRDGKGRQVKLLTNQDLTLTLQEKKIHLRGELHFSEIKVPVMAFAKEMQAGRRFLNLDDHSVGLIDGKLDLAFWQIAEDHLKSSPTDSTLIPSAKIDLASKEVLEGLVDREKIQQVRPEKEFQGVLRNYQTQGVSWLYFLYCQGFGGLLADEMGLGKTVQVLAFLSLLQPKFPILIVVPSSLVFQWKKEAEKFLPTREFYVHSGCDRTSSIEVLQNAHCILTSYAIIRRDFDVLFQNLEFSCVILDEAQVIKNPNSQIFNCICQVKSQVRFTITGTPIENRSLDLWAQFQYLMPDEFAETQVLQKAKPFILRREKSEVAKELPEKIVQEVWLEMEKEQEAYYHKWKQKIQNRLENPTRMGILEGILRLRQICLDPSLVEEDCEVSSVKLEQLTEDLGELEAKVIVFSQFTGMLKRIRKQFPSAIYLDGETKDRAQVVEQFQQAEDVSLFLISLKAGGVGLNLNEADYVFLLEPWWNEAVENQAIDRAHRIGREKPLIVRKYLIHNSIEEKMRQLKQKKLELTEELFAGYSMEELQELLIH